jgi:hypothetical protein
MMQAKPQALKVWHEIVEERDAARLNEVLADDVVFHSPVVHTPQVGKVITKKYLSAALNVLNTVDFKYLSTCTEGTIAVLEFETRVDGLIVNGVDLLKFNADGTKIVDFKVMVRPLKAINALHAAMARQLQVVG